MLRVTDIYSLSDFQRNARSLIEQVTETKRPIVLTLNGRAEVVIQDAEAYQMMVDQLQGRGEVGRDKVQVPAVSSSTTLVFGATPKPSKDQEAKPETANSPRVRTFAVLSEQLENHNEVKGGKPLEVVWPDGTSTTVKHWNKLAIVVLEWLGERNRLPQRYSGRVRSDKKSFINVEHQHADGTDFDRIGRVRLPIANQVLWVDTKRSAWDTVRCLTHLMLHIGEEPSKFGLRFKPGPDPGAA